MKSLRTLPSYVVLLIITLAAGLTEILRRSAQSRD